MKNLIQGICLLIALTFTFPHFVSSVQASGAAVAVTSPHQVCFSPDGGCTRLLVHAISGAKSEILIMAYSFRSPAVAQALLAAHKAGVKVALLMDKSERQEGFTPANLLANAGISVWLDGMHAVMNNRVVIIDGEIVMTGSFDFNSASEEMNAENLVILHSADLALRYRDHWHHHRKHSEKF